jgi:putative tricarboxylic transport membrane protein
LIGELRCADHGTNGQRQAGPCAVSRAGRDTDRSVRRRRRHRHCRPPARRGRRGGIGQKALNAKEHQQKAEQISLEPLVMKGDQYRKFLKDNEQSTKKLMGW